MLVKGATEVWAQIRSLHKLEYVGVGWVQYKNAFLGLPIIKIKWFYDLIIIIGLIYTERRYLLKQGQEDLIMASQESRNQLLPHRWKHLVTHIYDFDLSHLVSCSNCCHIFTLSKRPSFRNIDNFGQEMHLEMSSQELITMYWSTKQPCGIRLPLSRPVHHRAKLKNTHGHTSYRWYPGKQDDD